MSDLLSNRSAEGKRKVAIYMRVSTSEQKMDGYSEEAQRKKLTDYVEKNEALNLMTKPEWIFFDVHTGSDLNRDGYKKVMELVNKKAIDAVLVWKIDRLSRSLKHLLETFEKMESKDVSFISVQENIDFKGPIGKLIFQIFGAIAQFERELIRGRTNMGRIASAELGNYTGTHIPYGYKPIKNKSGKGKRLKIIPEEKAWVEKIYKWYIYDNMGDGKIADKLNELDVPKGKYAREEHRFTKWTEKNLTTILTNTLYRGEFLANKKDEHGQPLNEEDWTIVGVPECVSEFTFEQAQVVRKGRKGGKVNNKYLLRGKLKDMTLSKPKTFTGKPRTKGGYSYVRKFFKKEGESHSVFEIPAQQIEDYVWGKILEALKTPEEFIRSYVASEKSDPTRKEMIKTELNSLRERTMNIELEEARTDKAYIKGSMSLERRDQIISGLNNESNQAQKRIIELEGEIALLSMSEMEIGKLREASEKVGHRLEHLDRRGKQILCDLFIDRIEMDRRKVKDDSGKGKWQVSAQIFFRFNPSRFTPSDEVGRTSKPHTQKEKVPFLNENPLNGAQERT